MKLPRALALCLAVAGLTACFGDSTRVPTLAVTALLPVDAALDVDVESPIAVTFTKPVKPDSVAAAALVVSRAGAAISGFVSVAGASVLFTPARPFSPHTAYTARLSTAITDLEDKPLAAEVVWGFTTGPLTDRTAPTVARTVPAADAEDVSPRVVLRVGFSETMSATSIVPDVLILRAGTTRIDGALTFDGSTVTLTPSAPLPANTLYTATLALGPKDLAGNDLASGVTWSFRTQKLFDESPPSVLSSSPASGATDVPVSAALRVTFSEAMDPATLNGASFTLSDGTSFVSGAVSTSGDTAVFTPTAALRPATRYTAAVEVAATDLSGNALPGRSTFAFTTGPAAPAEALTVAATSPAANATLVALDTSVSASFSRLMDAASLNSASFTLARGDTLVGTTVSVAGSLVVLSPVRALEPSTTYTATLTTAVRDVFGVALSTPRSWTFSTGPLPDRTPPVVTQVSPPADALDVALTPSVTATFSEPLDASTVSAQTVSVSARGVLASGQVSVSGNVLRFVPTTALSPSTTYTVTLSIALKDVAGNALLAPYDWRFTTQRTPDYTPPAVTGSAPGPSATGIPVTTAIIVNFSEPVDPATVTPASFTLSRDNNPVAASVYGAGRTAILSPTAPLETGATYIVTVWTGITDLAGNPLPQNHNWFFSTAPKPDTTAPWIVSTTPSPGRQDVATTSTVTAVFSEALDATSVTPVTFTLSSPSAQIAGSVSANGSAVVFTPNTALTAGTRYTATLFGSIRDSAGNALNTSYGWNFVTASP